MKKNGESRKSKAGKKNGQAAIADNATERELLREVVKGLGVIADRVEAVRRTLWRMSEIREYESKGAKGKPEKDGKPEKAEGGEK